MKLGGFGRIADYDNMKAAGFDYAELDTPELEELGDAEFDEFCMKVEHAAFPVLSGARAIPQAEPWFFTDDFSLQKYEGYLKHACERLQKLGAEKVIIGNGKARWLTDASSLSKEQRFVDFMRMFCEIAGERELEVILEPLGPDYSNYINTLPQAADMVCRVDRPNLFIMADMRHMYRGGEPFSDILECEAYLRHLHIDYPETFPARPFPDPEDGFDYQPFLDAVLRSGYDGTITVEADIPKDWGKAADGARKVLAAIL